MAVLILSK